MPTPVLRQGITSQITYRRNAGVMARIRPIERSSAKALLSGNALRINASGHAVTWWHASEVDRRRSAVLLPTLCQKLLDPT